MVVGVDDSAVFIGIMWVSWVSWAFPQNHDAGLRWGRSGCGSDEAVASVLAAAAAHHICVFGGAGAGEAVWGMFECDEGEEGHGDCNTGANVDVEG